MELINNTPYSAKLFKTVLNDFEIACAPIVRVTYDVVESKSVPSTFQEWPVLFKERNSKYGSIPSDFVFRKNGVDIMVLGNAISKRNLPVEKSEVSIFIKNKLDYKVIVYGNRYWKERAGILEISVPEKFTKMPMNVAFAYGGFANWDGIQIPHNKNTFGKGYYIEKANAVNKALPNIEDPKNLISKWNDQPSPVGVGMCDLLGLKAENYIKYDSNESSMSVQHRFFNHSFPGMIVNYIDPGEKIVVKGMSLESEFSTVIPNHKITMKVKIGEAEMKEELITDQICLIPSEKKVFITYRYPFKYKVNELELRSCEIIENILL